MRLPLGLRCGLALAAAGIAAAVVAVGAIYGGVRGLFGVGFGERASCVRQLWVAPDYDLLKTLGADVRGKIMVARHARSHRAVKIHTARERGAVGIIVYSDPADDRYARGMTWAETSTRSLRTARSPTVVRAVSMTA
jgi:hypothetical protein